MKYNTISTSSLSSEPGRRSGCDLLLDDSDFAREKENITSIRGQLEIVQRALKTQTRRCERLVAEYTKRLQEQEQQYRNERQLRDDQLARVLRALLIFEARLKQEQKLISSQLEEKDYVIKKQRENIKRLTKNQFCRHCNRFYGSAESVENSEFENIENSEFENVENSGSETYATVSIINENESEKRAYVKNKSLELGKRGRRFGHRKSVGTYFEVLRLRCDDRSSDTSNEESLHAKDSDKSNEDCSNINLDEIQGRNRKTRNLETNNIQDSNADFKESEDSARMNSIDEDLRGINDLERVGIIQRIEDLNNKDLEIINRARKDLQMINRNSIDFEGFNRNKKDSERINQASNDLESINRKNETLEGITREGNDSERFNRDEKLSEHINQDSNDLLRINRDKNNLERINQNSNDLERINHGSNDSENSERINQGSNDLLRTNRHYKNLERFNRYSNDSNRINRDEQDSKRINQDINDLVKTNWDNKNLERNNDSEREETDLERINQEGNDLARTNRDDENIERINRDSNDSGRINLDCGDSAWINRDEKESERSNRNSNDLVRTNQDNINSKRINQDSDDSERINRNDKDLEMINQNSHDLEQINRDKNLERFNQNSNDFEWINRDNKNLNGINPDSGDLERINRNEGDSEMLKRNSNDLQGLNQQSTYLEISLNPNNKDSERINRNSKVLEHSKYAGINRNSKDLEHSKGAEINLTSQDLERSNESSMDLQDSGDLAGINRNNENLRKGYIENYSMQNPENPRVDKNTIGKNLGRSVDSQDNRDLVGINRNNESPSNENCSAQNPANPRNDKNHPGNVINRNPERLIILEDSKRNRESIAESRTIENERKTQEIIGDYERIDNPRNIQETIEESKAREGQLKTHEIIEDYERIDTQRSIRKIIEDSESIDNQSWIQKTIEQSERSENQRRIQGAIKESERIGDQKRIQGTIKGSDRIDNQRRIEESFKDSDRIENQRIQEICNESDRIVNLETREDSERTDQWETRRTVAHSDRCNDSERCSEENNRMIEDMRRENTNQDFNDANKSNEASVGLEDLDGNYDLVGDSKGNHFKRLELNNFENSDSGFKENGNFKDPGDFKNSIRSSDVPQEASVDSGFKRLSKDIPVFEGGDDDEANEDWYASASDQEDDEQRDVYRNNPVLECMNQILLQNISDNINSPPKSPTGERRLAKSNNKRVKFNDEDFKEMDSELAEDGSGYYEIPIQKVPNFYETPRSIYSNDYEQILMVEAEGGEAPERRRMMEYYVDMDTKSEMDLEVTRKSKIIRAPPALPPKPANLLSRYKLNAQQLRFSSNKTPSLDSEPDYCSISELNLPLRKTALPIPAKKLNVVAEINSNPTNLKNPKEKHVILHSSPKMGLVVQKGVEKLSIQIAKQTPIKSSSTPASPNSDKSEILERNEKTFNKNSGLQPWSEETRKNVQFSEIVQTKGDEGKRNSPPESKKAGVFFNSGGELKKATISSVELKKVGSSTISGGELKKVASTPGGELKKVVPPSGGELKKVVQTSGGDSRKVVSTPGGELKKVVSTSGGESKKITLLSGGDRVETKRAYFEGVAKLSSEINSAKKSSKHAEVFNLHPKKTADPPQVGSSNYPQTKNSRVNSDILEASAFAGTQQLKKPAKVVNSDILEAVQQMQSVIHSEMLAANQQSKKPASSFVAEQLKKSPIAPNPPIINSPQIKKSSEIIVSSHYQTKQPASGFSPEASSTLQTKKLPSSINPSSVQEVANSAPSVVLQTKKQLSAGPDILNSSNLQTDSDISELKQNQVLANYEADTLNQQTKTTREVSSGSLAASVNSEIQAPGFLQMKNNGEIGKVQLKKSPFSPFHSSSSVITSDIAGFSSLDRKKKHSNEARKLASEESGRKLSPAVNEEIGRKLVGSICSTGSEEITKMMALTSSSSGISEEIAKKLALASSAGNEEIAKKLPPAQIESASEEIARKLANEEIGKKLGLPASASEEIVKKFTLSSSASEEIVKKFGFPSSVSEEIARKLTPSDDIAKKPPAGSAVAPKTPCEITKPVVLNQISSPDIAKSPTGNKYHYAKSNFEAQRSKHDFEDFTKVRHKRDFENFEDFTMNKPDFEDFALKPIPVASNADIPKLPRVSEIIIPDEDEKEDAEDGDESGDAYARSNLLLAMTNRSILINSSGFEEERSKKKRRPFAGFDPAQNHDKQPQRFDDFDLSQNFEEFKLDDCEIEEYELKKEEHVLPDILPSPTKRKASTHVEIVRATLHPQSGVQQLKKKLDFDRSFKETLNPPVQKTNNNNEPSYEHFLECTGLSSKSILTPSRLLSNHKSVLKPKDVKLRSKVAKSGISNENNKPVVSSTIKYWTEPYI